MEGIDSEEDAKSIIGELSVVQLIGEVKKRPVVWDRSNGDNDDVGKRSQAWTEIVQAICPNGKSLSRRQIDLIRSFLKNKWHNLRTYHRFALLRRRKNKSFKHSKHLSFLESQYEEIKVNDAKAKTSFAFVDAKTEAEVIISDEEISDDDDCDRLFLLSLLDPLKRVPSRSRFGVKKKLMEVIDAAIPKR